MSTTLATLDDLHTLFDRVEPLQVLNDRVVARGWQDGRLRLLRALPIAEIQLDKLDGLARSGLPEDRGIVAVDDFRVTDRSVVLLRDWVDQPDLGTAIRGVSPDSWLPALAAITSTLGRLHDHGIAHGLPKPSRLRLGLRDGWVDAFRLVDPQLESVVRDDLVDRRYVAPELLRGTGDTVSAPTPRSDLYALGVSLLEILGGVDAAARIGQQPVTDLLRGVDLDLCTLIEPLLRANPEERPGNALELHGSLSHSTWSMRARDLTPNLLLAARPVGLEIPFQHLFAMLRELNEPAYVLGSSGAGKTTFLRHVEEHPSIREQWTIVRVELQSNLNGHEQILDACSEIAPPDVLGDDRPPFGPSMERIVSTQDQPLLLLVDDGDRGPLNESLAHCQRLVPPGRLGVVISSSESMGCDERTVTLAPLSRETLREMALPLLTLSLDPEEVLQQLESDSSGNPRWARAVLADWIGDRRLSWTDGRIFFDKALEYPGASAKGDLLDRVLDRVDDEQRLLLAVLATYGEPVPVARLGRISSAASAHLGALRLQPFVRQVDDAWGFQSDALAGRAREWLAGNVHPSLVDRLLEVMDEGDPLVFRGRLLLRATGPAAGAPLLVDAAETAARAGDSWRALQIYREVLPVLDRLEPTETGAADRLDPISARLRMIYLSSTLGLYGAAYDMASAMLEVPERVRDRMAELNLAVAKVAEFSGKFEEAYQLLQQASDGDGDGRLELEIIIVRARVDQQRKGGTARAREALERHMPRIQRECSPYLRALAWNQLSAIIRGRDPERSARAALRGYRQACRAEDPTARAVSLVLIGSWALLPPRQRFELAEKALLRADALYRALSRDLGISVVSANLARLHAQRGQFEKALEKQRLALALRSREGARQATVAYFAYLHLNVGRGRDAIRIFHRLPSDMKPASRAQFAHTLGVMGELQMADYHFELALSHPEMGDIAGLITGTKQALIQCADGHPQTALSTLHEARARYGKKPDDLLDPSFAIAHWLAGDATRARAFVPADGPDLSEEKKLARTVCQELDPEIVDAYVRSVAGLPDVSERALHALVFCAVIERAISDNGVRRSCLARLLPELETLAEKTDFAWIERRCEQVRSAIGVSHAVCSELARENRYLRATLYDREMEPPIEALGVDLAPIRRACRQRQPLLLAAEPGVHPERAALHCLRGTGAMARIIAVPCATEPTVLEPVPWRPSVLDGTDSDSFVLLEDAGCLSDASLDGLRHWMDAAAGEMRPWVVGTSSDSVTAWPGGHIHIPPLRDRPRMAEILAALLAEMRADPEVTDAFLAACQTHQWPGNFAELRRFLKRALSSGTPLTPEIVPSPAADAIEPYKQAAKRFEKETLMRALAAARQNVPEAARILRLPESTFRYKARKAGIRF